MGLPHVAQLAARAAGAARQAPKALAGGNLIFVRQASAAAIEQAANAGKWSGHASGEDCTCLRPRFDDRAAILS